MKYKDIIHYTTDFEEYNVMKKINDKTTNGTGIFLCHKTKSFNFIVNDILYGFTWLNRSFGDIKPYTFVFWEEECESFYIDENDTLIRNNVTNFKYLDTKEMDDILTKAML